MRLAALALLTAASTQAATYTNSFTNSDPALTTTSTAWNVSPAAGSRTPYVVTPSDGSVNVTGYLSYPQWYIDANPYVAGAGSATLRLDTSITGVSSFKLSEVSSISYQVSAEAANTATVLMGLSLFTSTGGSFTINALGTNNATVTTTRSGPGGTGDYIFTYTNFATDPNDLSFGTFRLASLTQYEPDGLGGFRIVRGQYFDITFQSLSITLGGAGGGAIPEPSTYGLMLGGLALAGAVIRRRAKK